MDAVVRNISGVTFIGKGDSNHWVNMDGRQEVGGSGAASSPMELVLIALGGCTGGDVASILEKMRIRPERFEIQISAERASEHPKVFNKISLEYRFWGNELPTAQLERAIQLSQDKYCSLSAMLKASAQIEYHYVVNPR